MIIFSKLKIKNFFKNSKNINDVTKNLSFSHQQRKKTILDAIDICKLKYKPVRATVFIIRRKAKVRKRRNAKVALIFE